MNNQDDYKVIEELINKHGLQTLLDAICDVCMARAVQCRDNAAVREVWKAASYQISKVKLPRSLI